MLIILAILIAYGVIYGGREIATEGSKNWSTLAARVRRTGNPVQKGAVALVSGTAWTLLTGGRGIAAAARNDRDLIRQATSPEARAARAAKKKAKQDTRAQKYDNRHAPEVATVPTVDPPAATPEPTPPTAPATGPTTGGSTVPATGEANSYEQMEQQIKELATDGDAVIQKLIRISEAAERLDAAAASKNLDTSTRAALNRVSAAGVDAIEMAGRIRPAAMAAGQTLITQQGTLREAYAAQPQAADAEFLKS